MKETRVRIEELEIEQETFSDDALFNITSFGTDLTFRELITMYDEGDLEKPEMQRKYVWSKNEASRFIDSVLLGLPVPSIFLAKTQDEKRLIVDGYQRIMTVYDYVKTGIFGGDKKPFKLSNSEIINARWRGKMFSELGPDEQRKIKNSTIHAIVFEQKHPMNDTGMYQIFERINTSGRPLKPQEIRNCVYHGAFNHLLLEINRLPIWREILDLPEEDSRMNDVELILRAFAFANFGDQPEFTQKQINLVKYLNTYMGRCSALLEAQEDEITQRFSSIMDYLYSKIGKSLFRNAKTAADDDTLIFSTKVNPSILDSIYAAADYAYKNDLMADNINLLSNYHQLLRSDEYQQVIKTRTTTVANIKKRIELATQVLFGVEYGW